MRRDEHLAARVVRELAGAERQRVGEPRPALDAEREIRSGAAADVHLAAALELGEQGPGGLREVDAWFRELAAQELAVHEAEEDPPPPVPQEDLARLEAGRRLVAARRRSEEEEELGLARRLLHRRRRVRERPLSGPELELRLGSCVLDRGEELRALLDERLVDEDEHSLAGLHPGRADEVPAPAGVVEPLHGGHRSRTRAAQEPRPTHSSPPS